MVNHSVEFVAPDGSHTQKIERAWLEIKQFSKLQRGVKTTVLDENVNAAIWRENHISNASEAFEKTIELIQQTDFS